MVKSYSSQVIPSTDAMKRLGIIFVYVGLSRRARREANIGAPRLNFGPLSRRAAGCIDGHNFTYTTSNPIFFGFLVHLSSGHPVWVDVSPQRFIAGKKFSDHYHFA